MDAELNERLKKLCEARRNYDNARTHLASVVERGEFGAVPDSQGAERLALSELLTAVTMTCSAAGESMGDGPSHSDLVRKQFEQNFVQATSYLAETLSLVQALTDRLKVRIEACPCTMRTCQLCRVDEGLLAKVEG